MNVEHVASLRAQLWDAGYRPVAIYNPDAPGPSPGKRPTGQEWQLNARQDPPAAVVEEPRQDALNTGILCDGLRAIDLDIDNATIAQRCRAMAVAMLGDAPIRSRQGSPRCLLVYRAAEGEPRKLTVSGTLGKIEVLGKGQQFVAFGTHHSGADLEWYPEPPGEGNRDALEPVTEAAVEAYLLACGPIIGADLARRRTNGHDTPDHAHTTAEPQADPLRIAAALAALPNSGPADWEAWNNIGMAIWRATAGSSAGWEAWNAWSARNASYDPATARERWNHYSVSPPNALGAGTIFHLAGAARDEAILAEYPGTGTEPPATPTDANYFASVEHDAHNMSAEAWLDVEARSGARRIPASPEAQAAAGPDVLWTITEGWDVTTIPVRPWIARGYLMRGSVTVVSGPASAGKSGLMVAWAVAQVIGSSFHGMKIQKPLRVLTYNVEDDSDEQRRRFSAVCIKMGIDSNAFGGNLAIVGPRQVGTLLHLGREGQIMVNTPVMDRLEAFIEAFRPDVVMLDPFVELHNAEENDNTAIRGVVARLRGMAASGDMAVVILHHARKGNGMPGDPDTLRGASSIVGAARVVLTVNGMTKEEAETFNVTEEKRRNYFRLDGAKNNYAPLHAAEWFERQEIRLPNGPEVDLGDGVAVAWPWLPPKLLASIPVETIHAVLDKIQAGPEGGGFYAPTAKGKTSPRALWPQLKEWLGINDTQAQAMVKAWLASGLLVKHTYRDSSGNYPKGVKVVDAKRPTLPGGVPPPPDDDDDE